MPEEFEAAGVPIGRRGNGFEDYIAALTSAWKPDPVSYEGQFYRIPRSYFSTGYPAATSLPNRCRPEGRRF
jgi:alkanesulfonate monooxygenase SsuD/methylene tetrahydromethanopterin reductase-like flavin-dependent oxidoreductase (luciferase family)